jgi:hypothetical protein
MAKGSKKILNFIEWFKTNKFEVIATVIRTALNNILMLLLVCKTRRLFLSSVEQKDRDTKINLNVLLNFHESFVVLEA